MINRLIVTLFVIVITLSDSVYAIIINKEKPVYYFTNHEEQISKLREKLVNDKKVGVTGITGMGKSELVRKYVKEYQHKYNIIGFLDVAVDLIPQFITIAREINKQICLKEGCYISEDPKNVKNSLMEYLKHQSKWLLIFDNLHINENDKIKDIIDWNHGGHIIICSQDDKYLISKIPVPYLKEEHATVIINKIMKNQSPKFVLELVGSLKGYPAYMIGHSAIFLQNNSHMTIEEYLKYMEKYDNKIRGHLEIALKEITQSGQELLYKMTLVNNQKIPRYLLEKIIPDSENLSDLLRELVRFGLIEQISEDRNNQIFRLHDAIKEELLNIAGKKLNQQNVNLLLDEFNNYIPGAINKRVEVITKSDFLESNLEILLNNADNYNADIYKIIELREKLLWYYLIGQRQDDNAKKMVDWFKNKASNISLLFRSDKEKAVYSGYLTFIGGYEYIINQPINIVMKYLDQAEQIAQKLANYDELKSYIYSQKASIQIVVGDIKNAKENIRKAEKARPDTLKTFLGAGLVEYNKSRILVAKGKYQEALNMLLIDIENSVAKNSMCLAAEYIMQARILNYMQKFEAAYDVINNKVYKHLSNKKNTKILVGILSPTLTELSRAELGTGKKEEALTHAIEAVNLLVEDKERNNKLNDLDNSKDIFLANALVAKGDALSAIGKAEEAMSTYRLVKNIYWNIYGIKNLGNMDNVSYLFAQAAKTAKSLPDKSEGFIQCSYFYGMLVRYFGAKYPRSQEIKGICN
ncbi:MAG: NB-ARC domain-containing protein [Candidatus Tisiphia sp.]